MQAWLMSHLLHVVVGLGLVNAGGIVAVIFGFVVKHEAAAIDAGINMIESNPTLKAFILAYREQILQVINIGNAEINKDLAPAPAPAADIAAKQ